VHKNKALYIFLLSLCLAFTACKGSSNSTESTDQSATNTYANGKDGAMKLLKDLNKGTLDGTSLQPQQEDYEAVFVGESADKARNVYSAVWATGQIKIKGKKGQSEILLWSATTEELSTKTGDSKAFPGGYAMIADKLNPGLTWYAFKFVESGKKIGMAYNGLVFVNGHWAIFPKPWRALK
jgi:hypothetical protein